MITTLLIGANEALALEFIRAKLALGDESLLVYAPSTPSTPSAPPQSVRKLWLFLSAAQTRALAGGNVGGSAGGNVAGNAVDCPDPFLQHAITQASSLEQVWIVSHAHHLPAASSPANSLQTIQQTLAAWLPAACRCQSICLQGEVLNDTGAGVDAGRAGQRDSPLFTTLQILLDTIHAIARRADQYFSRYRLQLVGDGGITLHLFQAAPLACALLAQETLPFGSPQLWHGAQAYSAYDLLSRIAAVCQHKILFGSAKTALGLDRVSASLAQELSVSAKSFRSITATPDDGLHAVPQAAGVPDLDGLIASLEHAAQARNVAMQRKFAELPGVTPNSTSRPGLRYFRYGQGEQVLLIVNAFGLGLDFWQMIAATLGQEYTVLALESTHHTTVQTTISELYYNSDPYLQDYLNDIDAIIAAITAAEGIEQFHLLSWCSGAKLAMELVCAKPQAVKSLCMITPSFAGMEGVAGNDSGYEKNLHTMCKLVNQMPKTAPNMANSMMAIMKKSAHDLERFQKVSKDAVDILGLVDEVHLPLLYEAFSNGDNLIAYSRQLVRFRAHDIRPCLGNPAMQLPVMLVTGNADATTSSERAKDICKQLPNVLGFELQGGSHYLLHQNFQLVAALLSGFIRHGLTLELPDPRLKRSLLPASNTAVLV
jgi:pimeloyl-ACP methyl ester carboxylesterase